MAAAITPLPQYDDHIGARTFKKAIRFVGDSSYPSGGYTSIRSKFGMVDIEHLIFTPLTDAAAEYTLRYDFTNDKLMVYNADTREEVSGSITDCDFRVTALGS